jgi:hypothetical protein
MKHVTSPPPAKYSMFRKELYNFVSLYKFIQSTYTKTFETIFGFGKFGKISTDCSLNILYVGMGNLN